MYRRVGKRILDVVGGAGALAFLWPVLLFIFFLLLLFQGRPVIFRQLRPGWQGKLFTIYKFKTMVDSRDTKGNLMPDSQRLTRIGSVIRKYSLDELPQLWNVLRGDLSLVGPRPLLPEYLLLYTPQQAKRHTVKPGLTGWAQVNGRNAISWEQKFQYDIWYVENSSFALDIKIMVLTVPKLIKSNNINASGNIPAERFTGTFPHAS